MKASPGLRSGIDAPMVAQAINVARGLVPRYERYIDRQWSLEQVGSACARTTPHHFTTLAPAIRTTRILRNRHILSGGQAPALHYSVPSRRRIPPSTHRQFRHPIGPEPRISIRRPNGRNVALGLVPRYERYIDRQWSLEQVGSACARTTPHHFTTLAPAIRTTRILRNRHILSGGQAPALH